MRKKNKNRKDLISFLLFAVYLALICYQLFFSESLGRTETGVYRYNIVPFREIIRYISNIKIVGIEWFLVNIVGNIVAFIPFGIFVTFFLRNYKRSELKTVVIGAIFSLSVETIQFVSRVGIFDLDDIILNSLGVFVGVLVFKIILKVQKIMIKYF